MMVSKQKESIVTFDATGKVLGRLASEVALVLRGKRQISFRPNVLPNIKVRVNNVSKLVFTGTKTKTKKYYHYSGYPGGLKITTLEKEFNKNPVRLFGEAVRHMLPKNRLAAKIIKNLEIYRDSK